MSLSLARLFMLKLFVLFAHLLHAQAGDTTQAHLVFVGDVMGHDPQIEAAYFTDLGGYDYNHVFQYVKPTVEKADYAVANLEVTLAGKPYKGYPQFSSPDSLAKALQWAGFDMLLTANNHSCDRNVSGMIRTLDVLDGYDIPHIGTYRTAAERANTYPFIQEIKGIKVAFLNMTYGTNGLKESYKIPWYMVNYLDKEQMAKDIQAAKDKGAECIIACTHWGAEYQRNADSYERQNAAFLFSQGVDIVIGGHPHVIQEVEEVNIPGDTTGKKGLIFYSHGNFVSNQRARYKDGGLLTHVWLKKVDGKVVVERYGFTPTWVHKRYEKGALRFFVVPVSAYERSPETFGFNSSDKAAFDVFKSDTRSHLKDTEEIPAVFPAD